MKTLTPGLEKRLARAVPSQHRFGTGSGGVSEGERALGPALGADAMPWTCTCTLVSAGSCLVSPFKAQLIVGAALLPFPVPTQSRAWKK